MKCNNSATATSRKQRAWQGVCTAFGLASQTFHTSRLFAMFLRSTEGKVLPYAVLHSLVAKTRRRVEWQSSAIRSLAQLGGEDTTPCRVATCAAEPVLTTYSSTIVKLKPASSSEICRRFGSRCGSRNVVGKLTSHTVPKPQNQKSIFIAR